jgi:hypothetical protein
MSDNTNTPAKKKKANNLDYKKILLGLLLLSLAGGAGWLYQQNKKIQAALETEKDKNTSNYSVMDAPNASTPQNTVDTAPQDFSTSDGSDMGPL